MTKTTDRVVASAIARKLIKGKNRRELRVLRDRIRALLYAVKCLFL